MLVLVLAVALAQDPAQWIGGLASADKEQRSKAEGWLKENGHRCKAEIRKAWEQATDDDLKTRLGWILGFVGRSFLRGKGNPVVALAMTDDERLLVVGRKDAIEVWDVEAAAQKASLAGDVAGPIAVRADGARIAFVRIEPGDPRAPREYRVRVIDASNGEKVWEARRFQRDYALGFSPDGKTLAVSGGAFVRLLDAEDGSEVRQFEEVDGSLRHQGHGIGFAFDAATSRFAYATVGRDWVCHVVVCDLADGSEVARFGPFRGVVTYLRFGKDGKCVLASESSFPTSPQRTAKLWQIGRGEPLEATPAVAMEGATPGLETLVGVTERGAVALTDLESGKVREIETGARLSALHAEANYGWAGGYFVLGPGGRYAAVSLGASGDVGLLGLESGEWR